MIMSEKKTILYVDDEEINLMLFEINFKDRFNIISAYSGYQGLKFLGQLENITIVISDMKMPEMNGIEFIRTAKQKFPNILFFILTGYEITYEIRAALEEKLINAYFRKPFNIKEIESAVNASFN